LLNIAYAHRKQGCLS